MERRHFEIVTLLRPARDVYARRQPASHSGCTGCSSL
jgi:hypothetical protein